MKDVALYLFHILECIERIERYTAGGRATLESEMALDAVLRNLQVMSESTQRLPDDLKQRHPDIPWRKISGFRNILVHDYLGNIDPEVVWAVVSRELAPLKAAMRAELRPG